MRVYAVEIKVFVETEHIGVTSFGFWVLFLSAGVYQGRLGRHEFGFFKFWVPKGRRFEIPRLRVAFIYINDETSGFLPRVELPSTVSLIGASSSPIFENKPLTPMNRPFFLMIPSPVKFRFMRMPASGTSR